MGGFVVGACTAVLIAVVAYVGYTRFDVPSGAADDSLSVKLESP